MRLKAPLQRGSDLPSPARPRRSKAVRYYKTNNNTIPDSQSTPKMVDPDADPTTTTTHLSPAATAAQQTYRQIAATNIRQLSTLSEQIPSILRTSALALSLLTTSPISTPTNPHPPPTSDTLSFRSAKFTETTQDLFVAITAIRDTLHAQIDAMRENGVIAGEVMREATGVVTNGGMGAFDTAVLNARARGGRIRDGEVLGRVEGLVGGVEDVGRKSVEGKMDVDG
ncbi:hypothetical protein BCR34DRAFT_564332 [Clohesyomyces aquaticus]|uniref:Mediator of RNA polymerase II transcription subunit 11 n=1 Tax=Clohesyomyces aquaticus TaxID=1231657 RepID=A0A1Y1ZQ90_9PLEO|nr:hypothetical protein BCR34DRAFT_564332 [Clohesyomyces aquaticus]